MRVLVAIAGLMATKCLGRSPAGRLLSAPLGKPLANVPEGPASMLNSTNWVGYISAIMLIGVSFAAVLLAPIHPGGRGALHLPPIIPAAVDANFLGNHAFGLWT